MTRITSLLSAALLASTATAHFFIVLPDSMVGKENTENEATGPCGGNTLNDDTKAVDFHVDGDAVAVADGHSQSDWLIRGTLQTDGSDDWEALYPIYQTRGSGTTCQPLVKVPSDWAGKRGVIGVAAASPDGTLYACAPVNFVEGTADQASKCTNGSAIQFSYTDNADLAAMASGTPETPSGSGSSSETSPSPESSATGDAADDDSAASTLGGSMLAGAAVAVAAAVGSAMLLL